ncbi:uncharacterized protein LOC142326837 [Lycorma delicatula]|uniref:uncharacterized protein LOC142326837 n=1 Tax=Lycorma delicatula TaxID=130591 RepID=UPI003F50FD46
MTSKILILALLVCAALCQEEEDDGSYNPEKYEKPYENLVDDVPAPVEPSSVNQVPVGFQQTQPVQQSVQPQQPPTFFQQPQPQPQPQPQFQQPQNLPQIQQPQVPSQNPFPNNPFFQRLQNPVNQPPAPSFQQENSVPQNVPTFQQASPLFQPQQSQGFSSSFRQPAPVNQLQEEGQPIASTNYQTGDGQQRTETVDNEGNVQGQYSYVDPNGKTITVRYSAGKDGFKVEGDNIPTSPGQQSDQPQQQSPPQLPQPSLNIPQQFDTIRPEFNPQQSFNNPSAQQFFNSPRQRSQFDNFRPQFQFNPRPRNNPQPSQFNQVPAPRTPFDFQGDGGYELQSSFQ